MGRSSIRNTQYKNQSWHFKIEYWRGLLILSKNKSSRRKVWRRCSFTKWLAISGSRRLISYLMGKAKSKHCYTRKISITITATSCILTMKKFLRTGRMWFPTLTRNISPALTREYSRQRMILTWLWIYIIYKNSNRTLETQCTNIFPRLTEISQNK